LIDVELATPIGKSSVYKGTVEYMELSLLQSKNRYFTYDEAVDVYALGVTLFQIINNGKYPFNAKTNVDFIKILSEGSLFITKGTDIDIAYMIWGCLMNQRSKRLTVAQLIDLTDIALQDTVGSCLTNRLYINLNSIQEAPEFSGIIKNYESLRLGNRIIHRDIYLKKGMLVDLPVYDQNERYKAVPPFVNVPKIQGRKYINDKIFVIPDQPKEARYPRYIAPFMTATMICLILAVILTIILYCTYKSKYGSTSSSTTHVVHRTNNAVVTNSNYRTNNAIVTNSNQQTVRVVDSGDRNYNYTHTTRVVNSSPNYIVTKTYESSTVKKTHR